MVEGNTTTPSEAIAEASGAESVNAFQLSLSEVVDRVRALSSLREARATFDWPNGIRLTVSEREPLFVWESGGRRYYVDEAGYLFPVRGAPTLLVTIRDLDSQPRTRLDERIVTAIRLLTRELPGIAHFEFSAVRGLSFQNEQGWKVIFGRPEKMETKLAVISALTRYFAAQKIDTEYLDVRLPERAFYKPK